MPRARVLLSIVAVLTLLAACGSDEPEADPSASETASTASPTPSPTPTEQAAPLTGEEVDAASAARPALAVKIENTEAARPQAGLEVADLVIEELVEGGITRFMAVFQSEVPDEVGPIRSARLVDAELLPAFDGALLYSGARPEVQDAISDAAVLLTEGAPGVYREEGRRAPSNLFAETPAVYEAATARAPDLGPPPSAFVFDEDPPPGACTACDGERIEISLSPVSVAVFEYEQDAGVYRRSQGDTPQPTVSGDPVGAANVAVVAVTTFEGGCCDTSGAPYVVSRTTGEGRAVVLRDGRWYEATWERAAAEDPWAFTVDGEPLPLAVGPTWLHLVPEDRMPAAPAPAPSADASSEDG